MPLRELLAGVDPVAVLLLGILLGGLTTTIVLLAVLPLEGDTPGRGRGRCEDCGGGAGVGGDGHDAART